MLWDRWQQWWGASWRSARRLGRRGERVAARHLRRRGLRILARNLQVGRSEIDLLALDAETFVLVEVKSRTVTAGDEWSGVERIDRTKRRALRRAAALLRGRLRACDAYFRVDAVCVDFEKRRLRPRVADVRWLPGILEV